MSAKAHAADALRDALEVERSRAHEPLRECVRAAIANYFEHLDGHATSGLFDLVIREVEAPLLEAVMCQVENNQSRAAEILGINRGTLRKKLRQYKII